MLEEGLLALWRTWWVGHRSKTHGGFKPGRLENVLVLFIRNREETNRKRRYGFGGKKSVQFSFSFELERGWYPRAVPCGRPRWATALLVAILGSAPRQAEGGQSLFAWVCSTL